MVCFRHFKHPAKRRSIQMLVRQQYLQDISYRLSILSTSVKNANSISLFDVNVVSETFYRDFLNALLSCNLRNVNFETSNTAGVDLRDDLQKIIVQVSSRTDKRKLQDALLHVGGCVGYSFYYIAIADEPPIRQTSDFLIPHGVGFKSPDNVWGISALLAKCQVADMPTVRQIYEICRKNITLVDAEERSMVNRYRLPERVVQLFFASFAGVYGEVCQLIEMCQANLEGNWSECGVPSINAHLESHLNRKLLDAANVVIDLRAELIARPELWQAVDTIETLELSADSLTATDSNIQSIMDELVKLRVAIEYALKLFAQVSDNPDVFVRQFEYYMNNL